MVLSQVSALLEGTPMKVETGLERLESGVLYVAWPNSASLNWRLAYSRHA